LAFLISGISPESRIRNPESLPLRGISGSPKPEARVPAASRHDGTDLAAPRPGLQKVKQDNPHPRCSSLFA